MLKKLSTLGMILMLTFYPAAALAETNVNADQDDEQVTNNEDADATSEDNTSEEDAKTEEGTENEDSESDESSDSENVEAEESDEAEAEESTEEEEGTEEEESDEAEADESEEEQVDEEEEAQGESDEVDEEEESDDEQADEDLNLREIAGTAKGDISYDFNKGYYVLDLRAGFYNWTNTQDIKDKWVAFTLPNGVYVLNNEDTPSGIIPIGLAGKSGIAVKVPDINGIGNESVNLEIPLAGEADDNDPYVNMHILNVHVAENTFEDLGQVDGQREIDFSVMEETPTLDLSGSITGSTKYDEDKKYHFLNLSVKALNETNDSANDLYVGFELPEEVEVVNDENTPTNMEIINLGDGKREVALKLPNLEQGDEEEVTYQIPVVGVSNAVVTSNTIPVYKISDSYQDIGEFEGHVNIDFSDMDLEWHFDAISEIITDYPGVEGNQVGFRFNYEVKNLDMSEVEKAEIEFDVPNDIDIQKPEYTGGSSVEVDWDGNTATVTLGDLDGASGYEGYFTAIGETKKSFDQLKELEVTVTLYRDGGTIVETLKVPFVLGKYDEDPIKDDDGKGGDDSGKDGDDSGKGGDDSGKGGDDSGKDGDDSGKGGDDSDKDGDDSDKDGDDSNKGGDDSDKDGDNVNVEVEDGDDSVTNGGAESSDDGGDGNLPNTATNMYTMLLIGALTLVAGGALMVFRKKSVINE